MTAMESYQIKETQLNDAKVWVNNSMMHYGVGNVEINLSIGVGFDKNNTKYASVPLINHVKNAIRLKSIELCQEAIKKLEHDVDLAADKVKEEYAEFCNRLKG